MTLKTKIARFILIVLAAAAATSAPGIAQETPAATKNTLPAVRTMTAADGRKLEGTILSKDATSIQFRRTTDGKEFMLELSKLSAQDQAFIDTLHAPAPGDHLIGDWVCNGVPPDIYSIKDDKSAIHLTDLGTPGTWQVTDQLLTIQWRNGYLLTIDTTQTGATVVAKSYSPGGSHIDFFKFSKASPTFPVTRILTDTSGRKLDGTILSKKATGIQFRCASDGKKIDILLATLSADDQKFVAEAKQPEPLDFNGVTIVFGKYVFVRIKGRIYAVIIRATDENRRLNDNCAYGIGYTTYSITDINAAPFELDSEKIPEETRIKCSPYSFGWGAGGSKHCGIYLRNREKSPSGDMQYYNKQFDSLEAVGEFDPSNWVEIIQPKK